MDKPAVDVLVVHCFALKVFLGENQLMNVRRACWPGDHLSTQTTTVERNQVWSGGVPPSLSRPGGSIYPGGVANIEDGLFSSHSKAGYVTVDTA